MDKSSKKLMTYAIILLVVPFVAFMSTKPHDVAADSPTISIIDVTTTTDYKIDVTVEVSLPDYTYTHYTKFVRLYLNQSASTIIANSYDSYNSTLTYDRQTEVTFEDNIFSPSLSNGSTLDSAYYNVSVVAISNLDEYSSVVEWAGGLIYIDTDLPEIVWITPTVSFEEIWGLYTVEVNLTDISNISQVKFIVDTKERYRISESDITEGQIYFNWTWDCSNDAPGQHILSVEAKDNSSALNTNDWSWTVDRKGPVLSYVDSIPSYIDSNDTLALNVSVTDPDFDVDYVALQYSIDDGAWVEAVMTNLTEEFFNYTLASQPVGTKINWRIFVNNTAGQYHTFKDDNLDPYEVYSVYPDHINPEEVDVVYESQLVIGEEAQVVFNITDQSPIDIFNITYKYENNDWEEITLVANDTHIDYKWAQFVYVFPAPIPVFTTITFYAWLNDSGGNSLSLDNDGEYYTIKILPDDLIAPNVTITESPDTIKQGMEITITVTIEETSGLELVEVVYVINNNEFRIEMTNVSTDTYTITFTLIATTGDEVEIFVQAVDEYYNAGISEIKHYTIETDKPGVPHSNAWLVLILIALIIVPVTVTILLLKPQK
ncbi:MAG: hypothetical protein ACTSXA_05940 [Candidatus Heimdallarchaeota archaeon]